MKEQYQTTFNYLLTHNVIPHFVFSNKDFFYDEVITNPKTMQSIMKGMVNAASDIAKDNAEIEPAFEIEKFNMRIFGDTIQESVIVVDIPNCGKACDCLQIAFTCASENARYFTCELSSNPLNGEEFFIVGEWKPQGGENLIHSNYGKLECKDDNPFAKTVVKIAFGKKEPEPLIVTEEFFDILQNKDGEMLFCIKNREGGIALPELFYSGGENGLLRRRPDQYIFLEAIHKDARGELCKLDKVLVAEFIPESEKKTEEDRSKGIVKEYEAPIRHLPESVSLDSIEDIEEDGYPLFAYLSAAVREYGVAKTVAADEFKEDLPNLIAVLAREEDYASLDECLKAGVSFNERVSGAFKSWQPSALFYITGYKVWPHLKDPVKMLKYLAENGADPNLASAEGDTPLGNQCLGYGTPEKVKALLEVGADPNVKSLLAEGGHFFTPLQIVVLPDDYDEDTRTFTPITPSHLQRAKLLVAAGADVNEKYPTGSGEDTPLCYALCYAQGETRRELVTLLRNSGADIDAALKSMETLRNDSPEFGYALYEFYAGFPNDKEPMSGISTWKDMELAMHFLQSSAYAGYAPAVETFRKIKPPPACLDG